MDTSLSDTSVSDTLVSNAIRPHLVIISGGGDQLSERDRGRPRAEQASGDERLSAVAVAGEKGQGRMARWGSDVEAESVVGRRAPHTLMQTVNGEGCGCGYNVVGEIALDGRAVLAGRHHIPVSVPIAPRSFPAPDIPIPLSCR